MLGTYRYLTVEASARQRYLSGLTSVFGSHDGPNLVGKALSQCPILGRYLCSTEVHFH